jgi:hypothetical protein
LNIDRKEWLEDYIKKEDVDRVGKEYLMLAVKWAIWKMFCQERYGNKEASLGTLSGIALINGIIMEMERYLVGVKDKKGIIFIRKIISDL